VGLNLIGASRIVLFDIDWNPATDLQAMARIHRDGQKLPVKIYRLLIKGALDEKMFQRQVMKMGLANAVVDNKASASSFSKEELRDLFRLDEREGCQTHELLGCSCEGMGVCEVEVPVDEEVLGEGKLEEEEGSDDDVNLLELRKASQVDMDAQEAAIVKKRTKGKAGEQPKLRMLMEYAHLDAAVIREAGESEDMASMVDDDVLLDVLKEPDCRVGFLLTKSSS
jgi:DNA repair and recombination protein RAD54B